MLRIAAVHPRERLAARRLRAARERESYERIVFEYEQSPDLGARIVRIAEQYGLEFWYEVTRLEFVVLVPRDLRLAQHRVPRFVLRLLHNFPVHVRQHLNGHPLRLRRYRPIRGTPPESTL